MTLALRASTELVGAAWLRGVVGDIVATTLPKRGGDGAISWAQTGFVVLATVGGGADMYVPMRSPVLSVDCWAVAPDSARPPWGKATWLAERIQAGCYDTAGTPRLLTLPTGYPAARVLSAYTAYEPRRTPDDGGSYARVSLGLVLHWVEVAS